MSNDTQRRAIRERLRRLMQMTVENGATEAEAMVAAEKAAALMAEHRLSYTTVEEIAAEDYGDNRRSWFKGRKGKKRRAPLPPVNMCLPQIAKLCGVEHWFDSFEGDLVYFGAPHATEAAHYLTVILSRAMDREWTEFKSRLPRGEALGKRSSFFYAMGFRIAQRLEAMKAPASAAGATGASLVVVGDAILKERFEKAHPRLKTHSPQATVHDASAVLAGLKAGDRVPINQGINEAHGAKMITGQG